HSCKWDKLTSEFERIGSDKKLISQPTNPLLLQVDNEADFAAADLRILIFGQETNGWFEMDDTLESILDAYGDFYNKEKCFSYGGQFWNGFSRFITLVSKHFPNKKARFLWDNIVKIGKSEGKGFPPDYVYKMEREHFSVIKEEIKIIKPNVIVFLTGPNYDFVIKDNFGELPRQALTPFSERQISKIQFPGVDNVFRTYHPNYLWRNDIDSYFERIIKEIKI
ncbi:MAG: uracil-DNA glycosylase family protein, partial [Bacteroidales bacterium]